MDFRSVQQGMAPLVPSSSAASLGYLERRRSTSDVPLTPSDVARLGMLRSLETRMIQDIVEARIRAVHELRQLATIQYRHPPPPPMMIPHHVEENQTPTTNRAASPIQGLELLRSASQSISPNHHQQTLNASDSSRSSSEDTPPPPPAPTGSPPNGNMITPDSFVIPSSPVVATNPGGSGGRGGYGARLYIDTVREFDVLCGRGGRSNHHPGNKRYRHVISEMKMMYRRTEEKTAKTDLSRAIVDHVCNYGGRFVKKDERVGRYYLLSKAEARKKTSQALRETKELKWTA